MEAHSINARGVVSVKERYPQVFKLFDLEVNRLADGVDFLNGDDLEAISDNLEADNYTTIYVWSHISQDFKGQQVNFEHDTPLSW